MNKYPLNEEAFHSSIVELLENDIAQRKVIAELTHNLEKALSLIEKLGKQNSNVPPSVPLRALNSGRPVSFDEEMSEQELSNFFGIIPVDSESMEKPKTISTMTLEEIKEWETVQDNSNDIYKVAARIKNLARGQKAQLTPVGEMLCNIYVHVVKSLYDFAEQIEDKSLKIKLIQLIRSKEGMPGELIAAQGANVKETKE